MTWRVVAASEVGTSHAATGKGCEDSCWAQVDCLGTGEPLLSMFICDGAGSALRGGEGAELAIQTAAQFLAGKLQQGEFGLSDALAAELVVTVRDALHARASALSLSVRDLACTFLGAISSPACTLVMQIGDGGIVLDAGAGLEVAVDPMAGEYANMTHFVTDEDAVSVLVTRSYPGAASRIAAFSDGVQRLALNMAANTPHEPFFAPFFISG